MILFLLLRVLCKKTVLRISKIGSNDSVKYIPTLQTKAKNPFFTSSFFYATYFFMKG